MNRAFISLYVIIVLSIVLLGLALNKFWDVVGPEVEADPAIEDIFQLAEFTLRSTDDSQKDATAEFISQNLHYQIKIINAEDFAKTQIIDEMKNGNIISAGSGSNHLFYKKFKNSDDVLVLSYRSDEYQNRPTYLLFIFIFYAAIAMIIFLWVWPLSRDLARLALHTKNIGRDGIPSGISISPRSVLFPFAVAFNKMTVRLNELISSQKEMTYAVSHELRTPLARMKFALAMIEDNPSSVSVNKQLASIKQDVFEMESLTNALLAYAGFEQQSQHLHQTPGQMIDLVQSLVVRFERLNRVKIPIVIRDECGGDVFVCEWSLMQTALQNLLDNAQGFAHKAVIMTLTTTLTEFVLIVEDDGPGVAVEERERIFESFVRLFNEQDSRPGFGLGLAIVKRVLRWHNGSVECMESNLGGAKFILKWPKPCEIKQ